MPMATMREEKPEDEETREFWGYSTQGRKALQAEGCRAATQQSAFPRD